MEGRERVIINFLFWVPHTSFSLHFHTACFIVNGPIACERKNFIDRINYGGHHIRTTQEAGLLCTKSMGIP